jgi:hypothetical protein
MVRSPPDVPRGASLKARTAVVDAPANPAATVDVLDGIGRCQPEGTYSLVEAVDLVSQTIAHCRTAGVERLLFDATGMTGFPVPTLIERFLMVEDWALESAGTVAVAMVARDEYIHPQKFGVRVAERFGLVCDVFTMADDALRWLVDGGRHPA